MSLREDAEALAPEIANFRHVMHQDPEIGLDLPRTQEKVLQALDGLGLEVTTGQGCTSVTAVLRGTGGDSSSDGPNPVVLLRGDMDALPVQEKSGVDFTSRNDGMMHACGHDLHTAMLVGAARVLANSRDRLAGDVVFMFQPGEEGWDGADVMIKEGVLEAAGRRVDVAYALHVYSAGIPHGVFATKPGVFMSASDGLFVTVRGAGGHGSAPHNAKDPVQAVAEMVTAMQVMVTRGFDMFDPMVITVGRIQAGSQRNIIPETASFEATVRTFSQESRQKLQELLPRVLNGIAASHGVEADIEYRSEYPATVNDVDETETAEKWIREVFGPERALRLTHPMSGSEDFSRVLAEVPGAYINLGAIAAGVDDQSAAFNHSPLAVFDDSVLTAGTTLYAELATRRLAKFR
jgi:hippurate hydrolase